MIRLKDTISARTRRTQKAQDASWAFLLLLFFCVLSAGSSAQAAESNSCVACHSETVDELKASVHFQQGVLCQKCHGGDPTQADEALAHSAGSGFIGVPNKAQIAEKCGSCHADVEVMNFYGVRTDQLARYKTSHHGKKLFLENDQKVAACSDCHGYHDVLPVSDPNSPVYPTNLPKTCDHCHGNAKLMDERRLPSDIFKTYESSVHGKALFEKKDLSVATCISCHGSHGAVPPGVKDVATTCGKCHVNEKKYFLESVHAKAQEEGKFNECISCHGNHGVQPVRKELFEQACAKCHEPGTPGAKLARDLETLIGDAEARRVSAEAAVKQASIDGFFVEDETALLEQVKTNVIAMEPIQHTLSMEKLSDLHGKVTTTADTIERKIEAKRKGLRWRKRSLVVIWAFIAVMVAALWTKYNQLTAGKKKKSGGKP